jgi:hypothetical protein
VRHRTPKSHLPQAAGLALRLEQHENVPLTNGPLMHQRKDSQFKNCGCSGTMHDGGVHFMRGVGRCYCCWRCLAAKPWENPDLRM